VKGVNEVEDFTKENLSSIGMRLKTHLMTIMVSIRNVMKFSSLVGDPLPE
jgi:hypothetical protein